MSAMSENEILQAAQTGKKVLDALYGLLGAIDQKTGFEQKAADADARYEAANQKELDKLAELDALQKKLDATGEDYEAANKFADKLISDAEAQANNTRLLAKNEAGILIQNAQAQVSEFLAELAIKQSDIETAIAGRQVVLDGINSEITTKTAELNHVQGDLDAAKDEIRRKFLN